MVSRWDRFVFAALVVVSCASATPNSTILGTDGFTEPVAHTYIIAEFSPNIVLQKKIYELHMKNVEVNLEGPAISCPRDVPEMRVMSDAARSAWAACTTPLIFTRVQLRSPESDFAELVTALEIISEDEVPHGSGAFFLSHPMESQAALLHGPTYSEYKKSHKARMNGQLVLTQAICVLLLMVLFMIACNVYRCLDSRISARAPPVLLGRLVQRIKGAPTSEPINTEKPDEEQELRIEEGTSWGQE